MSPKQQENREHELVTVFWPQDRAQAELIVGVLQTAGIESILSYESAGMVFGMTMDGLGQIQVKVAAEDADRATQFLDELEGSALGEDEELPADSENK